MVAVRGGGKGDISELFAQDGVAEAIRVERGKRAPQLFGQIPADGVGSAQHLECVESEAPGFVLDQNAAQAELPGQMRQIVQRRGRVLPKVLWKARTSPVFAGARASSGAPCPKGLRAEL